jgi:hypothetical protein
MITIQRAAQIAVEQAMMQNASITIRHAKAIAKLVRIKLHDAKLCEISTLAQKLEFEREFTRLIKER